MNHLLAYPTLHNTYFVMRHGESTANVAGIIVSDPKNGILNEYSLTSHGRVQVQYAAEHSDLTSDTQIYSSDFSRAIETAEIVRKVIGAGPVIISSALRERSFGRLEKYANTNYQEIWQDDATDPDHPKYEVEPVAAVLDRATTLISELEQTYLQQTILLVSHGDTLQILQTGFEGIDPSEHRSLRHFETAEIRSVTRS